MATGDSGTEGEVARQLLKVGAVNAACGIPHTTHMLLAGETVSLINVANHRQHQLPRPHHAPATAIDVCSGNFVTANANTISYWDLSAEIVIKNTTVATPRDTINDVCFLNHNLVAAAGNTAELDLFDTRTLRRVWHHKVASDNITTAVSDAGTVYCSSNLGEVAVMDFRTEKLLQYDIGHTLVDFRVENGVVYGLSEAGEFIVVDLDRKLVLNQYKVQDRLRYVMRFDRTGSEYAMGTEHGVVETFRWSKGMVVQRRAVQVAPSVASVVRLWHGMHVFGSGLMESVPMDP